MHSSTSLRSWLTRACALSLSFPSVHAVIPLNLNDRQSIIDGAGTASYGLMKWYNGNQTGVGVPGNLPQPYYWWEAGALMMCMIDYWFYTGDYTYNQQVIEAMVHQQGTHGDFMTENQTKTTGNDDQAFWGFAALEAAELKFPNPPDGNPSWVALAQGVFNTQAARWDMTTCGGGLRWQVFPFNAGYNYKNSISNGCFFSLGARLFRYTGNTTYSDWAVKAWDWTKAVNLMDDQYQVYDGSDDLSNCTSVNHVQYTYGAGVFLHGAASMWNVTEDPMWRERVDGLIKGLGIFFKDNIMIEAACEPQENCNVDMQSFKAYLARWLAITTQLCPWTGPQIMPMLQTSAQAAAKQCNGGDDHTTCGLAWTQQEKYDGQYGPGEQMAAMEIMLSNLINGVGAPVTEKTGGLSKGDPTAGGNDDDSLARMKPITAGDKAGAAILTILVVVPMIGGSLWLVW